MGAEGATRSQELQQSHAGLSKEVQQLRERLIETETKSQEDASRMQHESEELAMELEHIQAMGLAGAQSTARLQEEYAKLQADYEAQSVSTSIPFFVSFLCLFTPMLTPPISSGTALLHTLSILNDIA